MYLDFTNFSNTYCKMKMRVPAFSGVNALIASDSVIRQRFQEKILVAFSTQYEEQWVSQHMGIQSLALCIPWFPPSLCCFHRDRTSRFSDSLWISMRLWCNLGRACGPPKKLQNRNILTFVTFAWKRQRHLFFSCFCMLQRIMLVRVQWGWVRKKISWREFYSN